MGLSGGNEGVVGGLRLRFPAGTKEWIRFFVPASGAVLFLLLADS